MAKKKNGAREMGENGLSPNLSPDQKPHLVELTRLIARLGVRLGALHAQILAQVVVKVGRVFRRHRRGVEETLEDDD